MAVELGATYKAMWSHVGHVSTMQTPSTRVSQWLFIIKFNLRATWSFVSGTIKSMPRVMNVLVVHIKLCFLDFSLSLLFLFLLFYLFFIFIFIFYSDL